MKTTLCLLLLLALPACSDDAEQPTDDAGLTDSATTDGATTDGTQNKDGAKQTKDGATCKPGCNGCCKGGTCFIGSEDKACGIGGAACVDCAAQGGTCQGKSGTCKGATGCGPANCKGCCQGSICMPGNTSTVCGAAGVKCFTCGKSYHACLSGACKLDPGSKWTLKAVDAKINQDKVWDPTLWGEKVKPDPYFGIDWDTCSKWSVDSPCSKVVDNTFAPVWNHTLGTFTAGKIQKTWCANVGDADGVTSCSPPFNTIALCKVTVTDADFAKGSKVLTSCINPDDKKSYVTHLKLELVHVP